MVTTPLHEPLVPADCCVSDIKVLPIEIDRLRRSRSWAVARRDPRLGFYMFNLWCSAWQETPAGSLENDDDILAERAMCDPKVWPEVRAEIMRGWIVCCDRRIYHPVVSDIARKICEDRNKRSTGGKTGRRKQLGSQHSNLSEVQPDPVLPSENQRSTPPSVANIERVSPGIPQDGCPSLSLPDLPSSSLPTHTSITKNSNARTCARGGLAFAEWYLRYPNKVGRRAAEKAYDNAINRGGDQQAMLDGVDRYIRDKPPDRDWCHPSTWLNQDRWLDQPATPIPNGGLFDAAGNRVTTGPAAQQQGRRPAVASAVAAIGRLRAAREMG